MPNILVTGGAGFIGSHTCVALLNAGYDIVIADNFSNSKPEALNRIKTITGKDFKFCEVDLLEREKLEKVLKRSLRRTRSMLSFTLQATRRSASRSQSR